MTKKLACNHYIVSSRGGYNYKTDLTGPITFEHFNTSIYQQNDPKSLKEFYKIVAHFFTVLKTADESELSLSKKVRQKSLEKTFNFFLQMALYFEIV